MTSAARAARAHAYDSLAPACTPNWRVAQLYADAVTYARVAREFAAGDHLRVWRPLGPFGYYHHGVYVDDDRVVQFGGRIRDKRKATIGAVPLRTFEDGGTAKLVRHRGRTWWAAPRFDPIARDVTVRRAERLVDANPEGLYDLFGYNCEQAANFCSTNSYESYQVRGYFAVRSFVDVHVGLWVAARNRAERPCSRFSTVALAVWIMRGLVPNALYHLRGARFMRKVGRPLLEWERSQRT
jgi:hypothetical protein